MPSLEGTSRLGESHLMTDDGMDVIGTIFAIKEGAVPSYDYSTPRTFFRVTVDSFLTPSFILIDAFGRRFITATHDLTTLSDVQLYKTFRLFNLNAQMDWTRVTNTIDPLTGLSKSHGADTSLGKIWVSKEMISREEIDLQFRVKEQTYHIITNAPLQLNDKLDGFIVKRIDEVLGVTLAEIQ